MFRLTVKETDFKDNETYRPPTRHASKTILEALNDLCREFYDARGSKVNIMAMDMITRKTYFWISE